MKEDGGVIYLNNPHPGVEVIVKYLRGMTPSPKPKDPLEEFSENPLDIFSFYMGLLRNTIREVSPETWWGLLGQTPPTKN